MSQVNKQYWRSYDHRNHSASYEALRSREFPEGSFDAPSEGDGQDAGLSRRTFLKLMAASAALAGATGCIRRPELHIKPYVKRPEYHIPGKPVFYATAAQIGEDVIGVLAESHEGRPTKLEGNPGFPTNKGALNAYVQASVLNLYDPDRLQYPLHNKSAVTPDALMSFLDSQRDQMARTNGKGVGILVEGVLSPTFYRVARQLTLLYPGLSFYRYDGVNNDRRDDALAALGVPGVVPRFDFSNASVIASFGSDFLGLESHSLSQARGFSSRRDPDVPGGMSRLYVVESAQSVTGTKADHRIVAAPGVIDSYLVAVGIEIAASLNDYALKSILMGVVQQSKTILPGSVDMSVVDAIAHDLLYAKGSSLVLVGREQSAFAHALGVVLNQSLSNVGRTVFYSRHPFGLVSFNTKSSYETAKSLVRDLQNKSISTLFILGGDPVYLFPGDLNLASALSVCETVVHLTESLNDTSALAHWVVPQSHYLEAWGDLTSVYGDSVVVQPITQPLWMSYSTIEFLSLLLGQPASGLDLVRATWKTTPGFARLWKKWLHEGMIASQSSDVMTFVSPRALTALYQSLLATPSDASHFTVEIFPSYSLYDGRYANNGWLQELPDPMTKLTWDNAALMSVKTARKIGVNTEDLVTLSRDGRSVTVPVMIMPGVPDDAISLSIGFGRSEVGRVGQGAGFSVMPLLASDGAFIFSNVQAAVAPGHVSLATTQNHGSMEDRPIYREATLSDYKTKPDLLKNQEPAPTRESLFTPSTSQEGYQWGMVIDLGKCTGCNACITACQSENNIPIVGKSEVLNGREMHWIRLDRYFVGDDASASVVVQPMTCLHCELAPCEQVCPVAATVHSHEGTNDMVYNRCIGTRYCANNCPVKVRRFNYFDYHQRNPQSVKKDRIHLFDYFKEPDRQIQKQFNPDVTVRMRGVMEKCTYCTQRINEARITAKNENRRIRDGEIVTACQQTCPTNAIVFGDIRDPNSKVSKAKARQRDYELLEQLNLHARTTYNGRISNPNLTLVSASPVDAHHDKKGEA